MIKKNLSLVLILLVSISTTFSQTYVPDDNFEQALIDLGFDDVLDDFVVTANISALTTLNIDSKNISSLQGIEDFTSLDYLSVRQNNLLLLDVSTLSNLKNLYCEESNIETLILSSNLTKLERLFCDSNSISSLDFTGLTSLQYLGCSWNNIESLNFTPLASLDVLSCGGNQFTFLDLNDNPITILNCNVMQSLTLIYLKNNTDLVYYESPNPPNPGQIITYLGDCPNLEFICVDSSEQTKIQEHINSLGYTTCEINTDCTDNTETISFTDINFKNTLLELGVDLNSDNEISLREAIIVTNLDVSSKNITNINEINYFTFLRNINCSDNQLTNLNFSQNTYLTSLDCSNNNLRTLNVKNGNNTLITNFITTENTDLACIKVDDVDWSDNNWINIDSTTNYSLDCNVELPNIVLESCDNDGLYDGIALFDLTSLSSSISSNYPTNSNLIISYYLNEFNALHNIAPIQSPNNYLSSSTSLFGRVFNNDNSDIRTFYIELNVIQLTEPNLTFTIQGCDLSDGLVDGYAIFDKQVIDSNLTQTFNDHTLTYYTDANRTVEITSSTFSNTVQDSQDIYGKISSNMISCESTFIVKLIVGDCSQIVIIPDSNFKNALLNSKCVDLTGNNFADSDADTNNDGEIQVSEALEVSSLIFDSIGYDHIVLNLTGIESFTNLTTLNFGHIIFYEEIPNTFPNEEYTGISNINFTTLINLEFLEIRNVYPNVLVDFNITSLSSLIELNLIGFRPLNFDLFEDPNSFVNLDLDGCSSLERLNYSNSFFNIDFCQIPQLKVLDCHYLEGGEPDILDLSCLSNLVTLDLSENYLDVVNLKNNAVIQNLTYVDIGGNVEYPNFICIDDIEEEKTQIETWINGGSTVANSYCSFTPAGNNYTLKGTNRIDSNLDGCDNSDPIFPNLKFKVTDGLTEVEYIFDASGNYEIPLKEGIHTITPILENPNYYTISPTSITVDFPTDTSPNIQDFCITPIAVFNYLEVYIIPMNPAKPGFDSKYKIVFWNKGTTTISGTVHLSFSDDTMDFIESSITPDSQSKNFLTWNFIGLDPSKATAFELTFNINSPLELPPVNNGDILTFATTINPIGSDEIPNDNTFTLNQTVVNSFDPNDKTCLEGTTITPDLIGEFVHYVIRCENTGTAAAVNIVIKDEIDITKFDISTLSITDSSHDMVTEIDGATIEFIFKNINLPFDDAINDAYVAFKIKTLPTLQVGDEFENNAEIYFDYNAAIITNIAKTSIKNALGINDFKNSIGNFKMYPNPTEDIVIIKTTEDIKSIIVYNNLGKLLQQSSILGIKKQTTISTQNFASGIYFIKVETTSGIGYQKLIKN